MSVPCRLLLCQVFLSVSCHIVTASLCLGGSDIFTSVRENSPRGHLLSTISIAADPPANGFRLCVSGRDAGWFYLQGRSLRLNSSTEKVLDREVQGPVLVAELTCSEDDVIQSHFRILVEVLNENDNKPTFLQETIQPFTISELTAVNSVVFTVTAIDTDGDMIRYIIDQSSPDAQFFRIDLPNSGQVVLNKALDYETRTHLQLIMWAQESNTMEKFNTSAVLSVNIEDGDDQYPHFLPCTPVSPGVPVCMSPAYTCNITQRHQDVILEFSPGPIRAEDGDKGIDAPLIYTILSGGDQGRFVINNRTGEIRLTRAVDDRRLTPNFTLRVMVCQVDDRWKYNVALVLVRVLSENMFPPVFNKTTFKGFIIQSSSPASIVSTYGNQVLQVQVSDGDFSDGLNPNICYFLHPPSGLYQVTQGGVLIARTDQLQPFDRHILQVVARDEESGEEVSASVDIEVLQRGQAVPHGVFREQQFFGDVDTRLAGGIAAMILVMFLSIGVVLLLRIVRRRRPQDPERHTAVALGNHPNVVKSGPPVLVESPPSSRVFSHQRESSSRSDSFHGRHGVYTRRPSQLLAPPLSVSDCHGDAVGRHRFQSDLCAVCETPEGEPHTWDTLRSPDLTEGLQSTGVHSADITAVNSGATQRDNDKKNDQSEVTLQELEKLYRIQPSQDNSQSESRTNESDTSANQRGGTNKSDTSANQRGGTNESDTSANQRGGTNESDTSANQRAEVMNQTHQPIREEELMNQTHQPISEEELMNQTHQPIREQK